MRISKSWIGAQWWSTDLTSGSVLKRAKVKIKFVFVSDNIMPLNKIHERKYLNQ